MRLAVLGDVHGNLQALEAVLEHARRQKVDTIIIAGDLINVLPDSRACWDVAQTLNLPMVRGNHERYIYHYGTPAADPFWYSEAFKGLEFVVGEFSSAEREYMASLPLSLHFEDLLIVHASFKKDNDAVRVDTSVTELETMFAGSTERFILRGHNHSRYSVKFNDRHVETIGSVGLPLDGTPEAKYVIAEKTAKGWNIEKQQVTYDHAGAVKRFETSIFMEQGGPTYKIFLLELQTSRGYIVPFWNEYETWSQNKTLTLTQAIDSFLTSQ